MAKGYTLGSPDRREGQPVQGFFLLTSLSKRVGKKGGFLALTLADSSGTLDAKMWTQWEEALLICVTGEPVAAKGKLECYQGQWQICLDHLRPTDERDAGKFDLVDLLPTLPQARESRVAMERELRAYVADFANEHLRQLVLAFLDDPELGPAFFIAPAAKVLHHAFLSGLLEHVLTLVKIIRALSPFYPEANCDLVITGAILHDFGKVKELEWIHSFQYTLEGQLIGHISIVQGLLHKKLAQLPDFPDRLRILVEHMILSHHGRLEFGSPKLPMTPEAMLLSALDDLEAKFAAMRREFSTAMDNNRKYNETTEWVRSMDRALFDSPRYLAYEPPIKPAATPPAEAEIDPDEVILHASADSAEIAAIEAYAAEPPTD